MNDRSAALAGRWAKAMGLAIGAARFAVLVLIAASLGNLGTRAAAAPDVSSSSQRHVANNDALRRYANDLLPVVRDGFYAAGDGGGEIYVHSSAPCSRNAGAGDNGWQVRDATGAGCWIADITKPVSIRVWGARIDDKTDDLPAWRAAVAAMGSATSGPSRTYAGTTGTILFPSGDGTCSKLSATLQINVSGLTIRGDNPHASCFDPQFATGNGVQIGDATHYPFDVNIEHLGFRSDVVPRTAGASLELFGDYNVNVSDITCFDDYYTCVGVDQGKTGVNYYLDRIHTEGTRGVFGISLGAQGHVPCAAPGICAPVNVRLTRSELDGNGHNKGTGAGLNIVNVSGFDMEQNNEDYNYYSVWVHPGVGQYASGWYASDNQLDTSDSYGFFVDTTGGGKFTNSKFVTLWIASCGATTYPATCVLWQGPAHSIENITADWQVVSAFGHGVTINSGNDIHLAGTIAGNGIAQVGVYHGLVIAAGKTPVSDLTWDGRIGGSAGADDVLPPNSQQCAIYIPKYAVVHTIIARGDLSGNRHDPAVCDDSETMTNDYTGVVPGQPWRSYTSAVTCTDKRRPARTATGRYTAQGNTISLQINVPLPSDGSCTSVRFSLPAGITFKTATSLCGSNVMGDAKLACGHARAGGTTMDVHAYDAGPSGNSEGIYAIGGSFERQ